MTQVTIPYVDERIVQGLKRIAWRRGEKLDESLRRVLTDAVEQETAGNGAARRAERFDACTD